MSRLQSPRNDRPLKSPGIGGEGGAVSSHPSEVAAAGASAAKGPVETGSREGRHANALPYVRLGAALAVPLCHAWGFTGSGQDPIYGATGVNLGNWAVCVFLSISGYCILQSRDRSRGTGHFLWKRFLRVYPAYFVCMAVLLSLVAAGKLVGEMPKDWGWLNVATFATTATNVPVWTVRVEECLYLLTAALFVVGWRSRWVCLGLLVLAFTLNAVLLGPRDPDGFVSFWPYLRLMPYFFAGACLYRFDLPRRPLIAAGALVAFVALACLGVGQVVGPLLIPYAVLTFGLLPVRTALGWDLSYGVYIWHWAIFRAIVTDRAPFFQGHPFTLWLIGTPLVLLVACASWLLIEGPLQTQKNRLPALPKRRREAKVVEAAA